MEITQRQQNIIVGAILGDGHIDPKGNVARLQLKQSKEKKEYIFWLFKELQNLCKSAPKQRKDNQQWYVNTRYSTELMKLRQHFYPKKQKIIPNDIDRLLKSKVSLAVWFMDDGTLDWRVRDHYAYRLTTNCFSVQDSKQLVNVLKKNFEVEATVQTTLIRGKRYSRIHIGASGRDKFISLVQPYILSCFSHKLPPTVFNPSETRPLMVG